MKEGFCNEENSQENVRALAEQLLITHQQFAEIDLQSIVLCANRASYDYLARTHGWNIISFDLDPESPLPEKVKSELESMVERQIFLFESAPCLELAEELSRLKIQPVVLPTGENPSNDGGWPICLAVGAKRLQTAVRLFGPKTVLRPELADFAPSEPWVVANFSSTPSLLALSEAPHHAEFPGLEPRYVSIQPQRNQRDGFLCQTFRGQWYADYKCHEELRRLLTRMENVRPQAFELTPPSTARLPKPSSVHATWSSCSSLPPRSDRAAENPTETQQKRPSRLGLKLLLRPMKSQG